MPRQAAAARRRRVHGGAISRIAAVPLLALCAWGCAPVGDRSMSAADPAAPGAAATSADSTAAPWVAAIAPGDRVRWRSGRHWGTGTVLRVDADTLAVTEGDGLRALPVRSVDALSVSRGRRVSATRGIGSALGGALVGGLAGGLAGALVASAYECTDDLCGLGQALGQVVYASVGAGAGFTIGILWGLRPADQWDQLHPPFDPTRYQWAPVERPHGSDESR
jgi:hypothetical protein